MQWRFESADAVSAHNARRDLLTYLADSSTDDSDLYAAAMIFGELVGNAARHAPGPVVVEFEWDEEAAWLRVQDRGPGFSWCRSGAPDLLAEDGRGLFIVQVMAGSVAIERLPERGAQATARLPIRRRSRP